MLACIGNEICFTLVCFGFALGLPLMSYEIFFSRSFPHFELLFLISKNGRLNQVIFIYFPSSKMMYHKSFQEVTWISSFLMNYWMWGLAGSFCSLYSASIVPIILWLFYELPGWSQHKLPVPINSYFSHSNLHALSDLYIKLLRVCLA